MSTMEAVTYLVVLAYVLVFLAMTAAAARRAGHSVWQFHQRGERQSVAAILFRLSFAGAVLWPLVLAFWGNMLRPDPLQMALDGIWTDVIGHALCAIGACVAMVSQMHMGAAWRIGVAKSPQGPIVTDGPFEFSRNPVFLGQMLLFAGLFLVLPGLVQGVLTAAFFVAVQLQVRLEEKELTADLGAPYSAYRAQVRRWI
jgi:protein-S-isoprenylcysteine O-methyltransferase Ste14